MKRFLILSALCILLCLTLGVKGVDAQESKVDMTKWITLTVKEGANIQLDFAAASGNVWVKVTGVENEKEEKAPTEFNTQREYKATGSALTIYGAIDWFNCAWNEDNLTAVDVSKNVNLTTLVCDRNQLSSLDVSKNVNLMELRCSKNQLTSLDVSKNVNLTRLACNSSQLTSLDVSGNVNLTELDCEDNQLSSLDVTKNVNLTELNCGANQISSLDVSKNVNLKELDCWENQLLFSLDVSKNVNLTRLTCNSSQLTSLDVSGNVNLTELDCEDNQLSSLDVTKNVNLKYLSCHSNQLSNLDITKNPNLEQLWCYNNQLSSLDVSQNALLEKLWLYGNLFSTSALNSLYCQLPNRTGKQKKGIIYPAFLIGDEEQLVQSTNKTIMDDKNWAILYWMGEREINSITGHYSCGSTYALTLMPATLSHSLAIQGETWETTVTSTGAWKIDESTLPAWLSVSPQQGNSGTKVTVTAQANTEVEQRSAALTFVLTDDPTTKQVVILKQNSLLVTIAEAYTFPAAGETKADYLTVKSSAEWTVTSSAAWCTVEPNTGNAGTMQATVKAEANTGKEAREAALTFVLKDNTEMKQVVKVKQSGNSITVTPAEECTFPAAGEIKAIYFTVESTQAWTVTSSAAWCTVEPKEGNAGTMQATVKAEANTGKEAREAALTFALKANAEIKQVVKVKQGGNSIIVTPAEECTFPAAGETKANYLTVKSSAEWTVISSAAWCTVEPNTSNAGTEKATVKAEANTGKEAREAELTFALKANAEIKQVVKVKQEGTGKNSNAVEDALLAGVSVAPNPFTSQLVIKNSEGIKGRYEVVSANGVTVRSGSLQGSETVLRTEALKAGVYLLRILSGEGVKTFNVVKE